MTICDTEEHMQKVFWTAQTLLSRKKAEQVLIGKLGVKHLIMMMVENAGNMKGISIAEIKFDLEFLINQYTGFRLEATNAL